MSVLGVVGGLSTCRSFQAGGDREAERALKAKHKVREDWQNLQDRRGVAFSVETAHDVFQSKIKTPIERLSQAPRRLAPLRKELLQSMSVDQVPAAGLERSPTASS